MREPAETVRERVLERSTPQERRTEPQKWAGEAYADARSSRMRLCEQQK